MLGEILAGYILGGFYRCIRSARTWAEDGEIDFFLFLKGAQRQRGAALYCWVGKVKETSLSVFPCLPFGAVQSGCLQKLSIVLLAAKPGRSMGQSDRVWGAGREEELTGDFCENECEQGGVRRGVSTKTFMSWETFVKFGIFRSKLSPQVERVNALLFYQLSKNCGIFWTPSSGRTSYVSASFLRRYAPWLICREEISPTCPLPLPRSPWTIGRMATLWKRETEKRAWNRAIRYFRYIR